MKEVDSKLGGIPSLSLEFRKKFFVPYDEIKEPTNA